MLWVQILKRVLEIEACEQCIGAIKVIASIDKFVGKPICTTNVTPQV
jgi:hypothetical protein